MADPEYIKGRGRDETRNEAEDSTSSTDYLTALGMVVNPPAFSAAFSIASLLLPSQHSHDTYHRNSTDAIVERVRGVIVVSVKGTEDARTHVYKGGWNSTETRNEVHDTPNLVQPT